MKAYVGSALSNWEQARKTMSALRASGNEVTHDWTLGAEAFYQGDLSEKAVDIAKKCIEGVKECDFAFFLPLIDVPMQGMWAELGAALALDKPVIVYLPALFADPLLEPTVDAWLQHRGAFLFHPNVFLSGQYAECFQRLQIIENTLFERREAQRLHQRISTQLSRVLPELINESESTR